MFGFPDGRIYEVVRGTMQKLSNQTAGWARQICGQSPVTRTLNGVPSLRILD
jgi:hypothetical protein